MIMKRALTLLPLAAVLAFTAPAKADDMRSALREGYGRIVFDWNQPVRYAAEVVGGTLLIQFERPLRRPGKWIADAFLKAVRRSAFVQEARRNIHIWNQAIRQMDV